MSDENEPRVSPAELLAKIEQGWRELNTFADSLTDAQIGTPTDAAGWAVQDHLIHIADWERSLIALVNREKRNEAMGIDLETWQGGDYDKINAIMQLRSKHLTRAQARQVTHDTHQAIIDRLQQLTDEDLYRPFRYYQPHRDNDQPVILWISGNSYEHYEEHLPWMAAIVAE